MEPARPRAGREEESEQSPDEGVGSPKTGFVVAGPAGAGALDSMAGPTGNRLRRGGKEIPISNVHLGMPNLPAGVRTPRRGVPTCRSCFPDKIHRRFVRKMLR